MSNHNKDVLLKENAAILKGNHEGFLELCTDDVRWIFIGDRTLEGKDAIREYMAETYVEPPRFDVQDLVAEGDLVIAIGEITLKNKEGKDVHYDYTDVWRFSNGLMAELRGFVIETLT